MSKRASQATDGCMQTVRLTCTVAVAAAAAAADAADVDATETVQPRVSIVVASDLESLSCSFIDE